MRRWTAPEADDDESGFFLDEASSAFDEDAEEDCFWTKAFLVLLELCLFEEFELKSELEADDPEEEEEAGSRQEESPSAD